MIRSALFRASIVTLTLSSCFAFGVSAKQAREVGEPEAATGYIEKKAFEAKDYMVVAANPYASWAGKNILEKGGSAIDAAVAVQSMLSLVEPQSSGIGGGAFILYWDNKNKVLHTFDGRETAPKAVNSHWFIEGNKPMRWIDAVVGGKSVGVPGAVKALEMAQSEFGKLPWNSLFDDTIKTAEDGFKVSPRLAKLVALDYHPGLKTFPASSVYFFPAGMPLQEGVIKKNRKLAKTLRGIAEKGSDYLLKGEVAQKIVDAVNSAEINPGKMTLEDLANYEPIKREPVCWAILLDMAGNLNEGLGSNIFLVKDGKIRTPREKFVLPGVSRETAMELASGLGIECTEDDLDLYDAYNADEAFITSTSLCICPIASINGVNMPAGAYGPITQKLIDAYVDLVDCDFVQQYLDRL